LRAHRVGPGSEFRLFQDQKEIGRVDGTAVTFLGFATRDDAVQAAVAAHRALAPRRGDLVPSQGEAEDMATLLSPGPEGVGTGSWGFSIPLLPNERMEVFALARSRIIWRALQGSGISRRMRQFTAGLAPF
jgi:hypothetical protein